MWNNPALPIQQEIQPQYLPVRVSKVSLPIQQEIQPQDLPVRVSKVSLPIQQEIQFCFMQMSVPPWKILLIMHGQIQLYHCY